MKSITKKGSRKMSTKKPSANIKSESKEFDDVESLGALNNQKERKKLDGIDERIKFLKTELKSLLGEMKTDGNSDSFVEKSNLVLHCNGKRQEDSKTDMKLAQNQKYPKESQKNEAVEFKPNFNSTPSKFSEWLDKTIDEMYTESHTKKLSVHTIPHYSEAQIDLTTENPARNSLSKSSSTQLVSQEYIEELLYKSFLLQNSETYFSSSETSSAELNKLKSKKRQQKYKRTGKPQKKVNKGRPTQGNFRLSRKYLRRGGHRRMPSLTSAHSSVEIINLDSSSDNNKIPDADPVCVDLDVSNYDWSEPFDINKENQCNTDVQVVEHSGVNSEYLNCKNLKLSSPQLTESDRSVCHDESGGIPKKAWECPVCFERSKGQEIVATQCGHIFCKKCLENHISKLSNNCPSCRCDLKDKPFITLFNF